MSAVESAMFIPANLICRTSARSFDAILFIERKSRPVSSDDASPADASTRKFPREISSATAVARATRESIPRESRSEQSITSRNAEAPHISRRIEA